MLRKGMRILNNLAAADLSIQMVLKKSTPHIADRVRALRKDVSYLLNRNNNKVQKNRSEERKEGA